MPAGQTGVGAERTAPVLVIGAGQIGTAIAAQLARSGDVVLHSRRRESVVAAASEVGIPTTSCWFGDLLSDLKPISRVEPVSWDTLPGSSSDGATGAWSLERVAADRMAELVRRSGAGVVVDATNLATSLPDLWKDRTDVPEHAGWSMQLAADVVRGRALTVHRLLRRGTISRYLRVSTTGLAQRGLELPFTHGDASDAMMSPALWAKLHFAGMEHQTLWAVARSFPSRVGVIVPAAFVGFENFEALADAIVGGELPERSAVAAGEDRSYTAEELAVASSEHQLGALTRAEVARAAAEFVHRGSTRHDLLGAMTAAAITPSAEGRSARQHVVRWMRRTPGQDLASGALGPRTTLGLVALRVLRAQWPGPVATWLRPDHGPAAPADLSDAERDVALRAGVSLAQTHDADPAGPHLCVCEPCSRRRLAFVTDRIHSWWADASTAERLDASVLLDADAGHEGDLLALVWAGAGAEQRGLER